MANLHGSIDPVAWQNPLHPDQLSSKPIPNWTPLYAAPVAQQYEAGDMASAAAQGFRDGVASVAQQPQAKAVPSVQIVNCNTCKHAKNDSIDYPCNRCGVEFGDGPFNRWEAPQQAEAVPLPERDTSKSAEQQGLFRKFVVRRTDGSDAPGGKHDGCDYFVLDATHDTHAKAALAAYAESVEETHPQLAADMRNRYELAAPQQAEAVPPDVARDAAAYHWLTTTLTSPEPWVVFQKAFSHMTQERPPTKAELDAAIYAAIAQQEGQQP